MEQWFSNPANWLVWATFEYHANQVWDSGRRHYSARTIGEVIRHHTLVQDSSAEFKLNDHTFPDLARLYMMVHPERVGFFELRNTHSRCA
jgi:hypothetical protein